MRTFSKGFSPCTNIGNLMVVCRQTLANVVFAVRPIFYICQLYQDHIWKLMCLFEMEYCVHWLIRGVV